MALIVRLARAGLIHGDFNEFNLLIREIYPDSEYESDEADSANDDSPADTPMDPVEILDHGRVEQGKGVQRIIADPIGPDEIKESDQDDSEDDDDVIELGDGVQVEPILIDFPQMVSIQHPNADYYFNRDVECVRRFFRKRFRFNSSEFPRFEEVMASIDKDETQRLDALSRASGYGETTKDDKMLESVRMPAPNIAALFQYALGPAEMPPPSRIRLDWRRGGRGGRVWPQQLLRRRGQ
ncbi:Serine/threonine-protein kinase Rio2 [Malassezia pachydermatis]